MPSTFPVRPKRTGQDLVGFVVGKYFAGIQDKPDHMAIKANIAAAVEHAAQVWERGYLVFTPHLNTHHFEIKTTVPETIYQAFGRRVLKELVDFVYATPNWLNSFGGRLEVKLACQLGIPVFQSLNDLDAWRDGKGYYGVSYAAEAAAEKPLIGAEELPIVLVDGPYWPEQDDAKYRKIKANINVAERSAVRLWNAGMPCFTPHLNGSFHDIGGYEINRDRFEKLTDEVLRRMATAVFLLPGWERCDAVRQRIALAERVKKPVFTSFEDIEAWKKGSTYVTIGASRK